MLDKIRKLFLNSGKKSENENIKKNTDYNLLSGGGQVADQPEPELAIQKYEQLKENVLHGQQLISVGSWTHDILKDELFFTEEVYRILGRNPEDFDGSLSRFYELIHPEDLELVKRATQDTWKGIGYDIDYRVITPDGETKFVNEKTKTLYDENEKPVKIVGVIQDITKRKQLEFYLKEIDESLNHAQKIEGIGSWKYDAKQDKITWSDSSYHILGVSPENFSDDFMNFVNMVHPDDLEDFLTAVNHCFKGREYQIIHRVIKPDQTIAYISGRGEPVFDKNRQIIGIVGTVQDITEKRLLEEKLEESYENLRKAQALAHIGSWQMDIKKGRNTMSEEACEIYGILPELFDGSYEGFLKLVHPEDRKTIRDTLENPPREPFDMKFRILRTDGVVRTVYQRMEFIFDREDRPVYISGTIQDITEWEAMENKIAFMANHDELTKLPNRFFLREHISLLCSRPREIASRFALIMLDIDGFKYYNDALGYQIADQLILAITGRLKEFLGKDKLICRYSGDQFALVIGSLNRIRDYEDYAGNLLAIFRKPISLEQYELNITVSLGISVFPEDGTDFDTLLKHTNIALFRSKDQGRNMYRFYNRDMDIQSFKEFELRNDLFKTIENNQTRVYFQPIVDLASGEILAAEALIRWEHPTWGLVRPDEFITIAEETGFIVELGKWVLKEVCRAYKNWLEKGLSPIKIAINYSAIQLYEKDFVENILQTIRQYQLEPDFLIAEIVESVLINDINKVMEELKQLQKSGIKVALDDFGTGFSSLEYLNRINIDILKIDRSFIKNIPSDETSTIITEYIINLARKLRISLVAEGIENWEQLSLLKRMNCFAGQGYLYSRPVDMEHFEILLAKKRCKPTRPNDTKELPFVERRRYFRIEFPSFLEAELTIVKINGKLTRVGNTKVLIKNMGPGGLCFMSYVRFPVKRDLVLRFTAKLMGKEVIVSGSPIWMGEVRENIFEYGIEFTFGENERTALTGILNQYQIRLRNNNGQYEGSFIYESYLRYFSQEDMNF